MWHSSLRASLGRERIQALLLRARRSSFGSAVSSIMLANVGVQVISVATVPLLTRLYGPTEYGLFALFASLLSYSLLVGLFRYDAAIDVPQEDTEAKRLLHFCAVMMGITAALSAGLVLIAGDWVAARLGDPALADLLWFLPAAIAAGGVSNVATLWFARQRDFKTPSQMRLVGAVVDVSAKLLLGLLGAIKYGQVLGSILSSAVLSGLLLWLARRKGFWPFSGWDMRATLGAAHRYREFAIVGFPTTVLEMVALTAPLFFVAHYFGAEALGLFVLATRLVQWPAVALVGAIRPVFRRHAAIAVHAEGNCRRLFLMTAAGTAIIGVPLYAALGVGGPFIIDLVLDPRWTLAGQLIPPLALLWFVDFVANPVSPVFAVMQRQRATLFVQIFLVAGTFGAFAFGGGVLHDLVATTWLYAGVFLIKFAIEFILCFNLSGGGDSRLVET